MISNRAHVLMGGHARGPAVISFLGVVVHNPVTFHARGQICIEEYVEGKEEAPLVETPCSGCSLRRASIALHSEAEAFSEELAESRLSRRPTTAYSIGVAV